MMILKKVFKPPIISSFAGPVIITVAGIAMLKWSWLTWPDVLVDFGQQLYIAWQLSEGKILYSDIAYFHGPVAPYLNALWFRVFGVGIMTLITTNLVGLAIISVFLYRLLLKIGDYISATLAALVFMTLFAFPQLVGIGNYNYITPYEHSITYALLLSMVVLNLMSRFIKLDGPGPAAGLGLCVGLTFLTKVEVSLAISMAILFCIGLTITVRVIERYRIMNIMYIFVGMALIPPIIAVACLSFSMPPIQALQSILSPWQALLAGDAFSLRFYRVGMGTLDVLSSLKTILVMTVWYCIILGPFAVIALLVRHRRTLGYTIAAALFALIAGALIFNMQNIPLYDIASPLPVIIVLAIMVVALNLWKKRQEDNECGDLIMLFSTLLFGLVLMFEMILNVRIYHYGFALAMPATMFSVVALVKWVPGWINRRGGRGEIFAVASAGIILLVVVMHIPVIGKQFALKNYTVSKGNDRFISDQIRGEAVNMALGDISRHIGPDQTLVVFPEGVMLNYLSRRVNPIPYTNFMPSDILVFKERNVLRSLMDTPPDFVILVHKDTSEFGFRFFGRDYGKAIFDWVIRNYESMSLIGSMPLTYDRFGILFLRRRALVLSDE